MAMIKSDIFEKPGIECIDNLDFFNIFLAVFNNNLSSILYLPIDNDEAPSPFP